MSVRPVRGDRARLAQGCIKAMSIERPVQALISESGRHTAPAPLLPDRARENELAWTPLLENVRSVSLLRAQQTYGLRWEDAEDLAQQVQIRVAERLFQLRHPPAFGPWLRRLIHHAAIDHLRQHRPLLPLDPLREVVGATQFLWHESAAPNPYDHALLRVDLNRALARLPALYREPIRLHLLQGIPQDEVARLLGRPRSTIATQIERGLDRLRRILIALAPGER